MSMVPRRVLLSTRLLATQSASAASSSSSRSFHSSVIALESAKSILEVALRDGLKAAMKSKDRPATACLKAVLADITYNAKSTPNPSEPLPQESVMSTIRKAIQSRTQASESYAPGTPAHHPENYENLKSEIALLQSYLPTSPSSESVSALIEEVIGGLSQEVRGSKGVQGNVMKALWEKLGESAAAVDRKEVGKLVAEALKR